MQDEVFLRRLVIAALAVYRVADRLPPRDPLATALREAALRVTASFTTLFYNSANEQHKPVMARELEMLCSYFYIARGQNWIDRKNFDVLIQEYRDIHRSFFAEEVRLKQGNEQGVQSSSKRGRKPKKAEYISSHETKLSTRQQKILEFIQGRERSVLGVIARVFPDVSPRTIRRDLDLLVQCNLLIREGSTRDSIYKAEDNI